MWFKLEGTEPEHFLTQFLSRWEGMRVPGTGVVKAGVGWEVEFRGRRERVRVRDARVEGKDGEGIRVGVGWREVCTSFFRG